MLYGCGLVLGGFANEDCTVIVRAGQLMSHDLKDKMEIVRALMAVFRVERCVYIATIIVVFLASLYVAVSAYLCGKIESRDFFAFLGSSGVFSFVVSRLLHMFDRCIEFLEKNNI